MSLALATVPACLPRPRPPRRPRRRPSAVPRVPTATTRAGRSPVRRAPTAPSCRSSSAPSSVAGPPSRFLYSIADPANPCVPTASADRWRPRSRFYRPRRVTRRRRSPRSPARSSTPATARGCTTLTATFDCVGAWGLELTAALPSGPLWRRAASSTSLPSGTVPAIGSAGTQVRRPRPRRPPRRSRHLHRPGARPRLLPAEHRPGGRVREADLDRVLDAGLLPTATCGPTLDIVKSRRTRLQGPGGLHPRRAVPAPADRRRPPAAA